MYHKNAPLGDVHPIHNWAVADVTARDALTVVSTDIGKVCKVGEEFHTLASIGPAVWSEGGGGVPDGGTIGQVLTKLSGTDGDATWQDAASGGLTNFAESYSAVAPNDVIPVASLTPVSVEVDADFIIQPKGDGSILIVAPDGFNAGGNKRGENAFDMQLYRGDATQVASGAAAIIVGGFYNKSGGDQSVVVGGFQNYAMGAYSFVGGGQVNQATATSSTVSGGASNQATMQGAVVAGGVGNLSSGEWSTIGGGNSNTSTAQYSAVCGGNDNDATATYAFVGAGRLNIASGSSGSVVAGGMSNVASGTTAAIGGGSNNTANGGNSCIPGGHGASTRNLNGYYAYSSGRRGSTTGASQYGRITLMQQQLHAAAGVMTTDLAAPSLFNQYLMANNSAAHVTGKVICIKHSTGETSAWDIKALLKRGAAAANTILVTSSATLYAQDAALAACTVALAADTIFGGLKITITGIAATTISWTAVLDIAEINTA